VVARVGYVEIAVGINTHPLRSTEASGAACAIGATGNTCQTSHGTNPTISANLPDNVIERIGHVDIS
jgi:hypothetical protein